jgi:uncharacterized protein
MEGFLAFGKLALAVAIGLPLLMYLVQDSLIFHPQPLPESRQSAIGRRFANVERLFIDAADGTRLHAWHVRASAGAPLVLYFGGNAEEVSWMLGEAAQRAPGTAWLLVDYRGYGASAGSPSETALVADALRWYDHVAKDAKDIYVFGRSLGSGVAVQVAAERPVAGVILVAPFDSLVALGAHHYPLLPVKWMLRHRFESAARAPAIQAKLLCLVAERDAIIPVERSRRLYEAWAGPKQWLELVGAGHNSTDGAAPFWENIRAFLR